MTRVAILDPRLIVPGIPEDSYDLRSFRQMLTDAELVENSAFTRTSSLDEADVILAPGTRVIYGFDFSVLRQSSLYRLHAAKVVVYSADDLFHISLPGLYPACTKYAEHNGWALPAHYRLDHLPCWSFTRGELAAERNLLFSFVGSVCNHPVRSRLMKLAQPDAVLVDSSPGRNQWWDRSWEEQKKFKEFFREQLLRSLFVLCPRGVIDASIRLFEAMEAGAVPVIIADRLCLPHGPDWEKFCLCVPEGEVEKLPELLRSRRREAVSMGVMARRAWEQYFSPEASFATLVAWASIIQERAQRGYPWHVRAWARLGCVLQFKTVRRALTILPRLVRA
jgi:hypothetical protein